MCKKVWSFFRFFKRLGRWLVAQRATVVLIWGRRFYGSLEAFRGNYSHCVRCERWLNWSNRHIQLSLWSMTAVKCSLNHKRPFWLWQACRQICPCYYLWSKINGILQGGQIGKWARKAESRIAGIWQGSKTRIHPRRLQPHPNEPHEHCQVLLAICLFQRQAVSRKLLIYVWS